MDNLLNIVIALLAFGFVIFFHELCHYLMAKTLKIQAKEFAVGFGKSVLVYQNKKVYWMPDSKNTPYNEEEISYHLKMLPLGGYVLFDRPRVVDGKAIEGSYLNSFHPFKRILVLLAGPVGNLVLGLALFFVFFGQNIDVGPHDEVQHVTKNSYASEIGIQEGDRLIGVNGKQSFQIEDIKEGLQQEEFCLMYETDGDKKEHCEVQTGENDVLGVTMGVPASQMGIEAVKIYGTLIKDYTLSFVKIIVNLEVTSLNGPIGVVDAVQESVPVWNEFLVMMITINVAIAVANLLFPLSITDGGRIVIDLIAWIRGKQSINTKYINIVSVVLIIGLFATTTILDVQRLIEKLGWF